MHPDPLSPNLQEIGAPEILDALADGAYITDTQRRIVFWSRAAERITGWSSADVVGHQCSDNILVHIDKHGHSLCSEPLCPLHRAVVTGSMSDAPLLVFARHKQGHRIPVQVSVAPIRNRRGQTVGGIEIFRDWSNVVDDLQRAKVIQDHSLESELAPDPRIALEIRYAPQELVGGDFYRIEARDSDHYSILFSDVMGHGLAAALYTMQLRSLWEECRDQLASPGSFAAAMNRRLYRLTKADGYFATAVILDVDLSRGQLHYVNAGHPSPFLLRADGTLVELGKKSPALGLIEDSDYQQAALDFAPGDSVLLYTDGAIEITGPDDQDLGRAGLMNLVQSAPPGWDLPWLERKLSDFSMQIRLPDDLTLLRLRRV